LEGNKMSTEIVMHPKGLDRCAEHIRTAQNKAQRNNAEYLVTVGGELEKAQRLLADHHAGFNRWVREEFGWSPSYARRMIDASHVVGLLVPIGTTKNLPLPESEGQCRPLAGLPPEVAIAAWERAHKESQQAGKTITAASVKAVVSELSPDDGREQRPRKPAAKKSAEPQADDEIEPDRMLDEISYYALAFLDACPERADELEGLLLTWASRCKQR